MYKNHCKLANKKNRIIMRNTLLLNFGKPIENWKYNDIPTEIAAITFKK